MDTAENVLRNADILGPFTSQNIEFLVFPRKTKYDLGDNLNNFSCKQ